MLHIHSELGLWHISYSNENLVRSTNYFKISCRNLWIIFRSDFEIFLMIAKTSFEEELDRSTFTTHWFARLERHSFLIHWKKNHSYFHFYLFEVFDIFLVENNIEKHTFFRKYKTLIKMYCSKIFSQICVIQHSKNKYVLNISKLTWPFFYLYQTYARFSLKNGVFWKYIYLFFTVYHIYEAIIKLVFVHTSFPVLIRYKLSTLCVQQIALIRLQSEYHDSANMQKCINEITNQQQFIFFLYLQFIQFMSSYLIAINCWTNMLAWIKQGRTFPPFCCHMTYGSSH